MKRMDDGATGRGRRTRSITDAGQKERLEEIALQKASADIYERRWKNEIKGSKGDWWIAIGLYLVLTSIAFVVL